MVLEIPKMSISLKLNRLLGFFQSSPLCSVLPSLVASVNLNICQFMWQKTKTCCTYRHCTEIDKNQLTFNILHLFIATRMPCKLARKNQQQQQQKLTEMKTKPGLACCPDLYRRIFMAVCQTKILRLQLRSLCRVVAG